MEASIRDAARGGGSARRFPRFRWVDALLMGYLAWALPNFAARFWPVVRGWLHAHGGGG